MDTLTLIKNNALKYLSRREHSCLELRQKLARKGYDASLIEAVLIQLQAENLLSEERFIENFVDSRKQRGFGPLKIEQELRDRGIEESWIKEKLALEDSQWVDLAYRARQKRFGSQSSQESSQQAKQIRFLQSRGFTYSQIKAALSLDKQE